MMLCSSLMITIYYLFLEKEKMYQFNRLFLIFSLVFSYVVPFISIRIELPKTINNSPLIFEKTTQQIAYLSPRSEQFEWMNVLWVIYGTVTLFLLIKAIISVVKIKNIKGKNLNYLNHTIVLTKENISPFSFWDTIYLGESYFTDNKIDSRIFLHEKSHLEQKHSLDLFLVEFLKIFTWFNPVIYFYKKAIVTNHEFLADEFVLKNNFNTKDYQNLILQEIVIAQNYNLTHTFNFNNTKKRFIMMNTKKSKFTEFKQLASIPVLIAAFGLFTQKSYANNTNLDSKKSENKFAENTAQDKELQNTNDEKIADTIRPKKSKNEKIIKKERQLNEEILPPQPSSVAYSQDLVPADYPEGINVMRNKIASTFNGNVLKGTEGIVKSLAYIHIDDTGKVTNITISGDNETFNKEIARTVKIVNNNTIWHPATQQGKPVEYVYKLPMTMTFE